MIENVERILICKLKFYGDVLLITPIIESLKSRYPTAKIDLLLYKETKSIVAADPRINAFYLVEKKTPVSATIKNILSLRHALKKNRYDLIINLSDQWSIALLIASLGRRSLSYQRHSRLWNRLFTQVIPAQGEHVVEQNLSILAGLDFKPDELKKNMRLFYHEADYQSLVAQAPELITRRYVVIQPTSRQIFKCWADDKFAATIDHLHQRGLDVYLTCGPAQSERDQVNNIAALCQTAPDLRFAGKTSFLQLAALIDHAILYIGVDSAPMHMAAALGTPQVCLFGATKVSQWRPWSDCAEVLWAGDYHPMPERKDLDRSQRYPTWIPTQAVNAAIDRLLNPNHECV